MKCIYNGKILIDGQVLTGKALLFTDKIEGIVDEAEALAKADDKIDAKGNYISPGFIDIHIHGYDGVDTMDGTKEAIHTIANGICKNGVTSFLPTTMTMSKEAIERSIDAVREVMVEGTAGAEILGVHMEGPYISVEFKGAQNPDYIVNPTEQDIAYVKANQDVVRHITIAPEIPGAKEFIETISKETKVSLSMGHTSATFEEAMEGIERGIKHTTHLFNGMKPLHHRVPGALGAALASDVSCEAICDTIHIHKGLFPFLVKTKGPDKFVLVTDCMCAGGREEGEYALGGQKVIVKDGSARLESGTLAGSILKLNEALRNMVAHGNVGVEKAIDFATLNPAKVICTDSTKGSLHTGKDADIILFNENIDIQMTIGKGKVVYETN